MGLFDPKPESPDDYITLKDGTRINKYFEIELPPDKNGRRVSFDPNFVGAIEKVGVKAASQLLKRVGSRQTKFLPNNETLKQLYQSTHDWNLKRLERIKRTRTWKESDYKALALASNNKAMDRLLKLPKGAGIDDIGARAIEFRYVDAAMEVQNIAGRRAVNPRSAELAGAYHQAVANLGFWLEKDQLVRAGAGRTLRGAARRMPESIALKELFEMSGGPFKLLEWSDDVAKAFSMLDVTDAEAMYKFVTKLPKPEYSTWDKIFFAVQNGWLSGPPTQARNIFGNTGMALSKIPEAGIAGAVDALLSTKTGQRAVFSREATASAVGMLDGLREAWPAMTRHFRDTINLRPLELAHKTRMEERGFAIGGKTGEFIGIPMKLLNTMDEAAKAVTGRMELHQLAVMKATRKGLKGKAWADEVDRLIANPTPAMLNIISEEQIYRTFQGEGGKGMRAIMSLRSFPAVRYVLPFVRTPVNILKAAGERAPGISALMIGSKLKAGRYGKVLSGGASMLQQRQFSQDISKAVLGHLAAGYVALQFVEGKMTGAMPEDAGGRSVWQAGGVQEYSIRTANGNQIPISKIIQEPYSLVLEGTLQVLGNYMRSRKDISREDIAKIGLSFTKNIADRSFLRGLADMSAALADTDRNGMRWLQNIPTWFVPYSGALASIAKLDDAYYRRPETVVETVGARLPVVSKMIEPARDPFGRKRKRPGGAISRAFSPFQFVEQSKDPLIRELVDLYEQYGFAITFPSKSLAAESWGIPKGTEMTFEVYNKYLEDQGKIIRAALREIVTSDYYDRLAPEQKQKILQQTASSVRGRAKNEQRVRHLLEQSKLRRSSP